MIKTAVSALLLLGAASAAAGAPAWHWTTGPHMPIPRSEVAVAAVGPKMYVIGGYSSRTLMETRVDVFDVGNNAWTRAAPMPGGRNHIGLAAYDGRIYEFGGCCARTMRPADAGASNVYDPQTNRWSPIAPLPHFNGAMAAVVLGKRIHLLGGGWEYGKSVTAHVVYDPATNRYSSAAPLPLGRDHLVAVALGNRIYAIGGRIGTKVHDTSRVDIYNPSTDSWTQGAPMPSHRSGMAAVAQLGKVVVIGGEGGREGVESPAYRLAEAYDPVTNTWSELQHLPEGRHGVGAAAIGAWIYVPGGSAIAGRKHRRDTLLIYKPR